MRKKLVSILISLCIVFPLAACTKVENKKKVVDLGGGLYQLGIYGNVFGSLSINAGLYWRKDSSLIYEADALLELATDKLTGAKQDILALLQNIDNTVNTTKSTSQIYKFNHSDSTDFIEINALFYELLNICSDYYVDTDRLYNPAIYPLVKLWGMSSTDINDGDFEFSPPSPEEVERVKTFCDFDDIDYREENGKYYVKKAYPESMLDFGGMAKGYAADKAVDIAKQYGLQHASINISGNLKLLGNHPDGRPWRFAFSNPRDSAGMNPLLITELEDISAVASGDYERFHIYDNVRFMHIINPETGLPANVYYDGVNKKYTNTNTATGKYDGVISSVIVNESSTLCDIYSTTTLLMGIERASDFLFSKQMKGIINTQDKRMSVIGEHKLVPAEGFDAYLSYSTAGFENYGELKQS